MTNGAVVYLARHFAFRERVGWTLVRLSCALAVFSTGARAQAPAMMAQPESVVVAPGEAAEFNAQVSGGGIISYQWSRNDVAMAGATKASLVLDNVGLADVGRYSVTATNTAGTIVSAPAQLRLAGQL